MVDTEDRPAHHDQSQAIKKPRKKRTKHALMVSADFIKPAAKRLGVSISELSTVIGLKSNTTVHNYIKQGECPQWFRSAVSGVIAEATLGNLAKETESAQLPAVITNNGRGAPHDDPAVLVIRMRHELVPTARALLGSLGWVQIEEGN